MGDHVGSHRIARLMREMGLCGRFRCKKVRTTVVDAHAKNAANLLARNFTVKQPQRVWACDITAIRTGQGWLYLAVVLEVSSRRVVGWAMETCLETKLCIDALHMAIQRCKPSSAVLHHSDRGCQYTSHAYQALLRRHGMRCSMSRPGQCWDNAVVESFFSTLKRECVNGCVYASQEQAKGALFAYIEIFYNRQRLHSTLGYKTPLAFEQQMRHAP